MAIKEQAAAIPGLKTSFNTISMWGAADDIARSRSRSSGPTWDTVAAFADTVAAILADTRGTVDVTTSWEEGKPEVKIEVDRDKVARMGLTPGGGGAGGPDGDRGGRSHEVSGRRHGIRPARGPEQRQEPVTGGRTSAPSRS